MFLWCQPTAHTSSWVHEANCVFPGLGSEQCCLRNVLNPLSVSQSAMSCRYCLLAGGNIKHDAFMLRVDCADTSWPLDGIDILDPVCWSWLVRLSPVKTSWTMGVKRLSDHSCVCSGSFWCLLLLGQIWCSSLRLEVPPLSTISIFSSWTIFFPSYLTHFTGT